MTVEDVDSILGLKFRFHSTLFIMAENESHAFQEYFAIEDTLSQQAVDAIINISVENLSIYALGLTTKKDGGNLFAFDIYFAELSQDQRLTILLIITSKYGFPRDSDEHSMIWLTVDGSAITLRHESDHMVVTKDGVMRKGDVWRVSYLSPDYPDYEVMRLKKQKGKIIESDF